METVVPEAPSTCLRVLLVEDCQPDAELVELELRAQGFETEIVRVESRIELQAALDQRDFDVVLCEHSLEMGALAALRLVQRSGLDLPFVVLSRASLEVEALELMRAGAHDYLFMHALSRLGAVIERELREATMRAESRRLQQRLVLADRLSSVGMLAAGVAHEINNPLAYVLGNLEFALGHLARSPAARRRGLAAEFTQALTQAREGAERIRQTTRDLRVFCRSDHDERRPVNVVGVMESSIRMAWNEIRHRARLERSFEPVPSILVNEARLGQVFINLLVNAAQAVPEGDTNGNQITVSIRLLGDEIAVDVRDSGCGIAPHNLERIFDPFFTTKPEGIGSGIGLSICRSILGDVGGSLDVRSELGTGSCFRVRLPARAGAHSQQPPPAEIVPLRRARVMAIDDEPSLCAVLKRLLKRDHEVVSFTDAREALSALERDGDFDVVFCDLMMPSLSGIDFHRALAELDPDLASRVVFVTGGALNGPARRLLETMSNRVVEKPFDGSTLLAAINQVIDSFPRSGTWLKEELGPDAKRRLA